MSLDADMIGKQCVAAPVAKVTVGKDDFSVHILLLATFTDGFRA